MMDGESPLRATGAAAAVVTLQNLVAVAGEAAAGMGLSPITTRAPSRAKQPKATAEAEEPGLAGGAWPRGVDQTRRAFTS
jgi:hypothetical protein